MIISRHDRVPDVKLSDQDGDEHDLEEFHGHNVLLCFFPDTRRKAGVAAQGLTRSFERFREMNTEIIGVVPAAPKDMKAFADRYGVRYPLLSDEGDALARRLGVWDDKRGGQPTVAALVVDEDGRVEALLEHVSPERLPDRAMSSVHRLARGERWGAKLSPPPDGRSVGTASRQANR